MQNSKVQEISLIDPSVELSLSFSQLNVQENIDILQKIRGNDFSLNITDATVDNALSLKNNLSFTDLLPPDTNVKSIHITDSADSVVTNFDILKSLSPLATITLPLEDEVLTLSSTQVLNGVPLLNKIESYFVNITNVSINDLFKLKSIDNRVLDTNEPIVDSPVLPNIQNYYLKDSSTNFSDNFDEIISLGPNLKGLGFDGSGSIFDVSYHQWMASKDTLISLAGSQPGATAPVYQFDISDISANNVTAITSDTLVHSVVVVDSADQISANWTALESVYQSGSKLADLFISDQLPLKLSLSEAIKGLGTNPTASSLLVDKVNSTNPLIIKDTAANIQAAWSDLSDLYANGNGALGQLTGIEFTEGYRISLSASQFDSDDINDTSLKLVFPTDSVIIS